MDFSDPADDGWTVIGSLVNAYIKEKVPLSEASANWLVRLTSVETIVAFGPKSIWCALQGIVRAFLMHGRESQVHRRLLNLSQELEGKIGSSHAISLAYWLALRASQRELLPLVVEAGRFLHIDGFDWVEDELTPVQFIRALPVLYAAWAHALPNGMDKLEELIALELEDFVEKASWTRQSLPELIVQETNEFKIFADNSTRCSTCLDNYNALGVGLVEPGWITLTECTKTGHRFDCRCLEFLQGVGIIEAPRTSSDSPDDGQCQGDEEALSRMDDDTMRLCKEYIETRTGDSQPDPFRDAATFLYRTQGRRWLGSYEPSDLLCGTCFLRRELYIAEKGLEAQHENTPMPESFTSFCSEHLTATL